MLPADPMTVDPIMRCCQIAGNDGQLTGVNQINDVQLELRMLPECPPTRAQMDLSTMFMRFPDQDVAGVSECFRSNNGYTLDSALIPAKFYSVCCYSNG